MSGIDDLTLTLILTRISSFKESFHAFSAVECRPVFTLWFHTLSYH